MKISWIFILFTWTLVSPESFATSQQTGWPAIQRACEQRSGGSSRTPTPNCPENDPTGVVSVARDARQISVPVQVGVLERAVANCRAEQTRMGCERLRTDVAGRPEALANIQECNEEAICQKARSLTTASFIPQGLYRCASEILSGLVDLALLPYRALREAAVCYEDHDRKQQILGRGPWMRDLTEEGRQAIVQRMTCSDITQTRQRRMIQYIQSNRLDDEGFRRALDADGTLTPEQRVAIRREVSGVSGREVLDAAINAWDRLASGLEAVGCYKVEVQAQFLCEGAVALSGPVLSPQTLRRLAELTLNPRIAERIGAGASRSLRGTSRDDFVRQYVRLYPTSRLDNDRWIARASSAPTNGTTLFMDSENALLKTLNSTFNDKNAVTALTNLHQNILTRRVNEYVSRHPGLALDQYSDYKSSRFAFTGNMPPGIRDDLARIFDESNQEFVTTVRENNLVRPQENVSNWFRSGIGRSADQSSAAARYGRAAGGESRVQNFDSREVGERLALTLREAEGQRANLQARLGTRGLMEAVSPGSNIQVPRREVIEAVRKAGSNEDLRTRIQRIEGNPAARPLDDVSLQTLRTYIQRVDEFSPALRISRRESTDLSGAARGGLSADFASMGTHNLRATAEALAGSRVVSDALVAARNGERAVTAQFEVRRSRFQQALRDVVGDNVTCSGDDCVAIARRALTPIEREVIVANVARTEQSGMRLSFIRDNVTNPAHRVQLATHGEEIEKHLRRRLEGVISRELNDRLMFAIDMDTTTLNSGNVRLLIGRGAGVDLPRAGEEQIRRAFAESVRHINTMTDARYQAVTRAVY